MIENVIVHGLNPELVTRHDFLRKQDDCEERPMARIGQFLNVWLLQTLTAGIPFGRPYSAPFSVR
jgi:hypothetical protein